MLSCTSTLIHHPSRAWYQLWLTVFEFQDHCYSLPPKILRYRTLDLYTKHSEWEIALFQKGPKKRQYGFAIDDEWSKNWVSNVTIWRYASFSYTFRQKDKKTIFENLMLSPFPISRDIVPLGANAILTSLEFRMCHWDSVLSRMTREYQAQAATACCWSLGSLDSI